MRNNVRAFISVVLCLYMQTVPAQEKQILLLGTAHNIENTVNRQFEKLTDRLVSFNPGLICIETIPVWDTVSLQKVRSGYLRQAGRIRITTGLTNRALQDSVKLYRRKANKGKVPAFTYSRLGLFYYLQHDFLGNSNYNWFLAAKAYGDAVDPADSMVIKYLQEEKKSEFHNIIFPVAASLHIKQLYGVDDRGRYPEDVQAQQATQAALMKHPEGKEKIQVYMKAQADYAKAERNGTTFDLLNDTVYQQTISNLITGIYPEVTRAEPAKKMKELWEQRNLSIAQRIVSVIKENKNPRRVLVAFGAAHIPLLKEYLQKLAPGYRVIEYSRLP